MIRKAEEGWGECDDVLAYGQMWEVSGRLWITRPLAIVVHAGPFWRVKVVGAHVVDVSGTREAALEKAVQLLSRRKPIQ